MRSPVLRSMPLAQESRGSGGRQAERGEFFRLRADADGGHGEDDERHGKRLAVVGGGADVRREIEVR